MVPTKVNNIANPITYDGHKTPSKIHQNTEKEKK